MRSAIRHLCLHTAATALCLAVFAAPAPAEAAENTVDLYRVPEPTRADLAKIPKNLARWHMGANLILVQDNDQFQRIQVPDVGFFEESVFLSDNSALTYEIDRGQHDFIIDLGQFMRVSRFFLNNESAEGSFKLLSSDTLEPLKSGKWVPLTQPVEFDEANLPSVTFPEVETRFILVRLTISDGGLIGNFGATGPLNINEADFNIGKAEEDDTVIKAKSPVIDYDFAPFYTGTRVLFISGGPMKNIHHLTDEDPTTQYAFPEDEESVMLLDLRKKTQLRTFAANFTTPQPGDVQVYLLDNLPGYFDNPRQPEVATLRDARGNVRRAELAAGATSGFRHFMAAQTSREVYSVPKSFFKDIEDSYSARAKAGQNRSIEVTDDLERRYVIFRFIPDAVKGDGSYATHTADYRPGADRVRFRRAQAGGNRGINFSDVQVIGDVEFDDIIFTMEEGQESKPSGSPEPPPQDPPVISR